MNTKNLLGLRKKISQKRPEFVQQDHHKRKETKRRWRAPKGMHSKMRHGVWGRPASVNVGYRGPQEVRNMHSGGLMPVLIHNTAELAEVDTKTQGVIMAHIGAQKKSQLLTVCKQKGITVLNVKNIDKELQNISEKLTARKEAKKTTVKVKEEKTKAKMTEKKEEAPKTKEEERKEMEKVLTKRE